MIRPADPADAGAVAEIWNHYIEHTAVTFNSVVKSVDEVAALISAREAFFIVETETGVAGFATWVQFRGGVGYRYTIENTVLLRPGAEGRGFGRALMETLCDAAREKGYHSMWAGVSGENPDGVPFHARLGFREVARLSEVGHKYDRWMDLTLMQKLL